MNILAIDTSGPVCGVAVLRGDQIQSEHTTRNLKTHSVNLMPMVYDALNEAEISLEQVDRIACVVGPGSFTGVRIGVSTVKGLAHGLNLPCVPINALEAQAYHCTFFDGLICPIQDARAGQVYTALFSQHNGEMVRKTEDQPIAVDDLLSRIHECLMDGERCLFVGDGVAVYQERIWEHLQEKSVIAPPHLSFLRPSAVACLAEKKETTVSYLELMPLYLRAPSAERNRKLMEAMKRA